MWQNPELRKTIGKKVSAALQARVLAEQCVGRRRKGEEVDEFGHYIVSFEGKQVLDEWSHGLSMRKIAERHDWAVSTVSEFIKRQSSTSL